MAGIKEKKALTKSSYVLTEFLADCAPQASQLFFSNELIPRDLRNKVTAQYPHGGVGDMVDCLSNKVELDPSLYAVIVKLLQKINGSDLVVKTMKDKYGKGSAHKTLV